MMREWTTKDLAEAASVDPAYIRQLLIAEKIDGYKKGRDWFVSNEEAHRWLDERRRDLEEKLAKLSTFAR